MSFLQYDILGSSSYICKFRVMFRIIIYLFRSKFLSTFFDWSFMLSIFTFTYLMSVFDTLFIE